MSTLTDFNKAVAKSALAYATMKQKEEAYNLAYKELQEATAESDLALERVKSLVKDLDQEALNALQGA